MEKSYNGRDGLLSRSSAATTHNQGENKSSSATTSSHDFVLQWGNRKRLRCMKFQNSDRNNKKHDSLPGSDAAVQPSVNRVDRRLVRSDQPKDSNTISNGVNGYFNLRQRPASPSNRILRNSETMRAQSNGVRGLASPDRGATTHDKRGNTTTTNHHHHHDNNATTNNTRSSKNNNNDNNNNSRGGRSPSSETTTNDGKKGGSPSGSDAIPAVWHPKFAIALTNKEKEEDFLVLKGSKLPQRPKKRAKFVQRTVNLISPGAWLCDLSLERYEVREKKVSKKRPRGLKAMGNMESDSE